MVAELDMVFAAVSILIQIEYTETGSCGSEQNAAAFVFKRLPMNNQSKPFLLFKDTT